MTFAVGVFISFLVYIAIGVYVGRRVENQTDYFVAGRGAPALLITGSLVASYLSTVGFMGEVGFAYAGYALPLLTMAAFNAAGYVVGVIFFGRYLRRSESLTIPEFFGKRFNSKVLQALTGMTVIIGLERIMNLDKNRIIRQFIWMARSSAVRCFPHSQAVPDRVHNSL